MASNVDKFLHIRKQISGIATNLLTLFQPFGIRILTEIVGVGLVET